MDELIGTVADAGAGAFAEILEYGLLGAMFLLSLALNAALLWLLRKSHKRFIDHLETHYREIEK